MKTKEEKEDNLKRYERIKNVFNAKNEKELAEKIKVHLPQIYRMKTRGFYPSHKRILDYLLDKIDKL